MKSTSGELLSPWCLLGGRCLPAEGPTRCRNDDFSVPAKVLRVQPAGCGRDPSQSSGEAVQRGRRAAVTVSLGSARSGVTWERRGDRLFIKRFFNFIF